MTSDSSNLPENLIRRTGEQVKLVITAHQINTGYSNDT